MTVRAPYQSVRAEDMEQEEKSGVHRRVSLRMLPATTADCPDKRPCPYATCKYNTVINVTRTGTIVLPFGEDIDGWPENNCALDNADLDGMTHQDIGECMGIVRERVRQIEDIALRKLAEPAIRKMLSGYGGEL